MVDSDLDLLTVAAAAQKLHVQKRKLKQKREPNWTLVEKETLRNICLDYMDIINNRRTDNEMCGLKNRTWVKITDAMREAGYNRNVSRVREAYARMKKIDKGVVVLQLSSSTKLKDELQNDSTLSNNKYYSDEGSNSDESHESRDALRKRVNSTANERRRSTESCFVKRTYNNLFRRPLSELQLRRTLPKISLKQQQTAQIDSEENLNMLDRKRSFQSHVELEHLNLKTEIDPIMEEETQQHQQQQEQPLQIQQLQQSQQSSSLTMPLLNATEQQQQHENDNENNNMGDTQSLCMQRAFDQHGGEILRKSELHRCQLSAEEKRLTLLDLQLEQLRMQMHYERHLYEKELESKQYKLDLMRRYKK